MTDKDYEIDQLKRRIASLEAGECRLHCKMRKDMWLAGFKEGSQIVMNFATEFLGLEEQPYNEFGEKLAEDMYERWNGHHDDNGK